MPHWEDQTPPKHGCLPVLLAYVACGFSAVYIVAQVVRVIV
jgi:hypothetical protein